MAKEHLKKKNSASGSGEAKHARQPQAAPEPQGRHTMDPAPEPPAPSGRHTAGSEPAASEKPAPKKDRAKGGKKGAQGKKAKKAKGGQPAPAPQADQKAQEDQAVQALLQVLEGGAAAPEPEPEQKKALAANKHTKKKEKPVVFRRARAKKLPGEKKGPMLSRRDKAGAAISLTAAVVLLAATVVIWLYRDSFSPDGLILTADSVAVAKDEYVFDAGSGEAFAAAGQGLAVANASGLELLDSTGSPVTSMVMQMESPTAAGCDDYAVFYDLGGKRLAVARFDGTVEELTVRGAILSATVSEGGYLTVTTEYTGFRALVTVYDPQLEPVYEWYASSAWVISGVVSPDGRKLAVLSYTASGSEVRFFSLNKEDQQGSFAVSDTILLDVHWFTADQLCAISSDQALFFNSSGEWQNTYSFAGQYLIGYTFDGSNCAAFALSPYRAGTTATLVSLDASGGELGTAAIQSELVCLTASDLEIMVLCSDGAILYNSSLTEKSRLTGLAGFKYGLLRSRGEALLIASNYAEVYTF